MNSEPSPALAAAASSPSSFRRIFQISLRTFFVLLTVSCIGLGVLTKRARDQRAAVNRILELGGSVSFDYEFDHTGRRINDAQPPGWRWLRRQIGDEYFRDVVRVNLDKTSITDDDLRLIGKLRATKILKLNWTQVSDAGLAHIGHLRQLEGLELVGTQITDEGLRNIENSDRLDSLVLGYTSVGDGGIDSITRLKRLSNLNLQSTRVSSDGVKELLLLAKLTSLCLSDTKVDDSAVESIGSQTSVANLYLERTGVSGGGLLRLRDTLPSCEISAEVFEMSEARFDENPRFAAYWALLVERLTALNNERRLKLIDLSGSQITDRYLSDLVGLSNVEVIDLRDTKVTDAGVEALRSELGKCRVER